MDDKTAVSIAEMARMVGLSRARFYQLIGTTFPFPIYDIATRRPFYPPDVQQICREVRQRNCGIDGKPVLFYASRTKITHGMAKRNGRRPVAAKNQHADLIEGLKALGLEGASAAQVDSAVKKIYAAGVKGTDEGEVLRAVFLHLKRKDSHDNLA